MTKDNIDEDRDDKSGTLYGETQLLEDPNDYEATQLNVETQLLEDPCDYEATQLFGETQALDDPVGPGFTEVLKEPNYEATQLYCETQALENPVGPGFTEVLKEPVDTGIETQLVDDMGDWIETQLVDHKEEQGKEAEEENVSSENGRYEADCGIGNCGEREEKDRLGEERKEKECLVDSDASTDDEDCGSGIVHRRLSSLRVASIRSGALAASRNFSSKLDTTTGNGTLTCSNLFSKFISPCDALVGEKTHSETDSGLIQVKNKTARELFPEVVLKTDRVTSISAEPLPKDSVPALGYVESQEPGILSQENALEVVDKLIAFHDASITPEKGRNVEDSDGRETVSRLPHSVQTGTIQLAKNMGPVSLAKKVKIFDWDDVKEDETGGYFFAKRKDLFFDRRKLQSQPPKGKERKKAMNLGHSDSRLVLQTKDKVSYESITKNLYNEKEDEEHLSDRVNVGAIDAMDKVGPDTQIAVEAIQALVDGSPGRPGLSEGTERVEVEREEISNDRTSKPIASAQDVKETVEKARRRRRKKLMPDEDKLVNSAKKIKVATKDQPVVPEKVVFDVQETGLDIFSNSTPIPRRPRSSKGTGLPGKTITDIKNSGQNATCRDKRVFIRSATELLGKAKKQRRVSLLDKQKISSPCTEIHKASPVFTPKKYQKKALDGGSYRPSVQKELLRLEMGESSVLRKWKDLRVRKDLTDARVLLSHHLDDKVIRQQRKILKRLGIPEAFSMSDGTHFVADQFVRTRNFLEAMARGKPIVTPDWLQRCNLSNQFVDEKNFILRDAKKEKEMCFSMPNSLATACHSPLLKGKRVLITPNVKPSLEVVRSLVAACGGTPMERIVSSLFKRKMRDDLLLVSCEEDYQTCRPLLEKGVDAYSSELILNGIVIQKLEFERHLLFSDCVKRTRSTIWLRDEGGKFLPTTKCA